MAINNNSLSHFVHASPDERERIGQHIAERAAERWWAQLKLWRNQKGGRKRKPSICKHTGQPIKDCPHEVQSVSGCEYEPELEHVVKQCAECGTVSFATREKQGE